MLRSSYYAPGYAAKENPTYLPMAVNSLIFFFSATFTDSSAGKSGRTFCADRVFVNAKRSRRPKVCGSFDLF